MATSLQDRLNKLQTLEEELESVSLGGEVSSKIRPVRRVSSSQHFQQQLQRSHSGLGISIPPRRPSDNLSIRQSSKNSFLERPISHDSIGSTTNSSEFSEGLSNSRNSSLTSESIGSSIGSSPIVKNSNFSMSSIEKTLKTTDSPKAKLRHTVSTPKFFPYLQSTNKPSPSPTTNTSISTSRPSNLSSTSLSTLKLTPSQKLRLKRQNSSKVSIRDEREKCYNDLNSDDDDDTLEDNLIWNVPYTKGSANVFSPSSGSNPHLIKSIIDQSPVVMPMSPLPGTINSAPTSPMLSRKSNTNLYTLPDEAHSISYFYQVSSESYAKRELENRKASSLKFPSMVKQASFLGLDDLQLVSEEKAKSLSSTRPVWLPPKSSKECLKHEKDISKMLDKAAKLEKEKQEQKNKEDKLQEKNKNRWVELLKKGVQRSSAQAEMKKICLKTSIPNHLRYEIWTSFLNKLKTSDIEIETYNELNKKFGSLSGGLPTAKVQKMSELIENVYPTFGIIENQDELNSKLLRLLQLLLISKISIVPKFDEYLLGLLLLKFNEIDSFNLFYQIKTLIFSEELMIKFDTNLTKNYTLTHELKSKDFKTDLESLSSSIIMFSLSKLSDIEIAFQFFDILILNTNYRVLYCLFLTVLKNYHFGYKDIDELINEDNKNIKISVSDRIQFFDKFNHYYKKFF